MVIFKSIRLYDNRDDLYLVIKVFPHRDNNVTTTPEYGSYTSQHISIHYVWTCSLNSDFFTTQRHRLFPSTCIKEFCKNLLILSSKSYCRKISTLCWKVLCNLRTDDKRLYWHLKFGSKLPTVSILFLSMVFWTITIRRMPSALYWRTSIT